MDFSYQSNIWGLYLPLLISVLFVIFGDTKSLFRKDIIVIFIISTILSYITSSNTSYSIHIYTVFPIATLILIHYRIIKPTSYAVIFSGTFLSLFIVDSIKGKIIFNADLFDKAIGGAGVEDGLVIFPFISVFLLLYITALTKVEVRDGIINCGEWWNEVKLELRRATNYGQ